MNVALLTHTPNPEAVMAASARLCYSNSDIEELVEKYTNEPDELLSKIMKLGHFSVLEHATFTFGIEGISRACSHQLVRHRIASYSQQSQRYVQAKQFEHVIPDSIKAVEGLEKEFQARMANTQIFYDHMISVGVPAEDARFILPNAACTKLTMTMNARELLHFFAHRTCRRAQWEIRAMAKEMLMLVRPVAPIVFNTAGPGCFPNKPCPEGKMTCGCMVEVNEEYKV